MVGLLVIWLLIILIMAVCTSLNVNQFSSILVTFVNELKKRYHKKCVALMPCMVSEIKLCSSQSLCIYVIQEVHAEMLWIINKHRCWQYVENHGDQHFLCFVYQTLIGGLEMTLDIVTS